MFLLIDNYDSFTYNLVQAFYALGQDPVVVKNDDPRLLELALVVPAMESWVQALQPGEAFCASGEMPDEASGVGLVEAARGSLGHWLSIRRGRIERYQIIAPTTWNFSPRDSAGQPGPLEQALIGTPVPLKNSSLMHGQFSAGAVKRLFGCAPRVPSLPSHTSPFQLRRWPLGGRLVMPSHQTSPSSVSATLVKIVS